MHRAEISAAGELRTDLWLLILLINDVHRGPQWAMSMKAQARYSRTGRCVRVFDINVTNNNNKNALSITLNMRHGAPPTDGSTRRRLLLTAAMNSSVAAYTQAHVLVHLARSC